LNAVKQPIIKPRTDSQDIIYKRGYYQKQKNRKKQNSRKEKKATCVYDIYYHFRYEESLGELNALKLALPCPAIKI
jgi:hypothetical protein